jgi:hypothetical protein
MMRSEGGDGEECGLTHRLPSSSTEHPSPLAHNVSLWKILDLCSTLFRLDYSSPQSRHLNDDAWFPHKTAFYNGFGLLDGWLLLVFLSLTAMQSGSPLDCMRLSVSVNPFTLEHSVSSRTVFHAVVLFITVHARRFSSGTAPASRSAGFILNYNFGTAKTSCEPALPTPASHCRVRAQTQEP